MKKPTKKNNTQLSVNEFKSWMSGVEDMQETGWVPNKIQWERIRSKIALLSEDIVEKTEVYTENHVTNPMQHVPYPQQPVMYNEQVQQPTYYEPQHFESPQFSNNELISYSSGEAAEFI